ncbi:global transactivator [Fusarium coicis]|nr:global transactivator [Fusarium coicis]
MIIAKHEAPRSGRIPGLKYGNTLFDHQKHAVGAALRSLAGPLKGMTLGDPQGFARPRYQWMAEIDAFFDAYRVAITSFSYLTEEVNRVARFQDAIKDYNAELAVLFPKRPKLVLRSGRLESEPWKPIGKCMIFDESHIIKNRNTRTFAVVTALRHLIADFNIFLSTFKELGKNAPRHPTGRNMIRSQGRKSRGKASRGKKDHGSGWLHLIEAQQYAYHPMLVQLKLAYRGLMESLEQVAEWCRQLEQGDNSLSRRVETIFDTMQQHLDLRPGDSFIIVDESVWFLDIVAIALKKTYHPVANDAYNGCGPRWKKAWEEQAAERVNRPGQQKPTFIRELRAQDCAVEKCVMEIRDKKNRALDAIGML